MITRVRRTLRPLRRALRALRTPEPPPAPPPQARPVESPFGYPLDCVPRWGWGLPAHPELAALIGAGRDRYRAHLQHAVGLVEHLTRIGVHETDVGASEPFWDNRWFAGLDAAMLYATLVRTDPATYVEVGSGMSTRFVRRAIRDHSLRTRIVSIDPSPRAEVDAICDHVIRRRLEDTDLGFIAEMTSGDVFFYDGSHLALMNSDAVVALLEVLPRLPSGVLAHFHDIFLPWDYHATWDTRYYGEQYVLAALLLGDGLVDVEMADHYAHQDLELDAILEPLWAFLRTHGAPTNGISMWLRRR